MFGQLGSLNGRAKEEKEIPGTEVALSRPLMNDHQDAESGVGRKADLTRLAGVVVLVADGPNNLKHKQKPGQLCKLYRIIPRRLRTTPETLFQISIRK